jgi:hypothetical protein
LGADPAIPSRQSRLAVALPAGWAISVEAGVTSRVPPGLIPHTRTWPPELDADFYHVSFPEEGSRIVFTKDPSLGDVLYVRAPDGTETPIFLSPVALIIELAQEGRYGLAIEKVESMS